MTDKSFLEAAYEFASRDFICDHVIRQSKAIDAAIAAGVFPVRVGNFMLRMER